MLALNHDTLFFGGSLQNTGRVTEHASAIFAMFSWVGLVVPSSQQ